MDVVVIYFCLAFAAGITSYLFYFRPALLQAEADEVENEFTLSPKLSGLVFTLLVTLIAPLIIFIILIPSMSDRFQDKLTSLIQN